MRDGSNIKAICLSVIFLLIFASASVVVHEENGYDFKIMAICVVVAFL